MTFTTRPEIQGAFGVVASTHWIGSAVGMKLLEQGGTAADAAAGTAFALQVVEPHLNGPLGDLSLLYRAAGADAPQVLCGQGVAPAKATIEHYRAEGLELIPSSGLLPTVVPGAFGAWMTLLRDHGRLPLREILEPAIFYAGQGHPALPRVSEFILGLRDFFLDEWPTSFETWCPGGQAPAAGAMMRNPVLADTWERLLTEAEVARGRDAQIDRATEVFYRGFIAEAIDRWVRDAEVADATGERRKGVLSGDDLAAWRPSYEAPVSTTYEGWEVFKAGFWSQGPVLLQSLRLLEGSGVGEMDLFGERFVHTVTETKKLSYADREAYYGDPAASEIPTETLISPAYADARRSLIGETASLAQRPGVIDGFAHLAESAIARAVEGAKREPATGAEPTMAHLTERRGDTVHVDVIDQWGNSVSATPSGGWLQSSPVVPGLGMALNTRAQMFWLEPGLPTSLAPGRRPRTTLSPTMATAPDGTEYAFGTPGGDQQDQWQLIYLLRLIHGGMNLQEAIDAPLFHTGHFQSSFYPRAVQTGYLMVEPAFGETAIDALKARGHDVTVAEPWSIGRLTAASRSPDGLLKAAATPRLMQAYASGR
ncbi:MAG: gamma-glutamyltransferase [Paracoccaceae bacterium]|nr:gamma-glutamyltransferase [Paracoccaceae bacterium]